MLFPYAVANCSKVFMPSQSQPLILSFHQMKTVRVDDGLFQLHRKLRRRPRLTRQARLHPSADR